MVSGVLVLTEIFEVGVFIIFLESRTHKGGVWPEHPNAGLRNLVQIRWIFVVVLGGTGALLGGSKLGPYF